jgi:pimeloyl-ACP methyl ester carboxylesterase
MQILLIHGLGRTALSMVLMGNVLRRQGLMPSYFSYWPWLQSYDEIVDALRSLLEALAHQGPYVVIAHSLGGILCRSALQDYSELPPAHLVMLGPPNQLPRLGERAWQIPPFQWFARDCGYHLAQAEFYASLPILRIPYTIIAGTAGWIGPLSPFGNDPNDGIVSVSETLLVRGEVDPNLLTFPVLHTFIMNHPQVHAAIQQRLHPG